ncbi:hypothetical protein [Paenibacillus caui]|uniref:hypothetical protein n=1 Tax=Paenibacillus caui TaxID=2873927 RepID=UPI001CA8E050|nr:hypothetical protein [Paenibacillus caui]
MESAKPRMLWMCSHLVLRYEEVPLWIEAGLEVIPALGHPEWIRFDSRYDDETDPMYVDWRAHCTLPTNVSDRIRRVDLADPGEEGIALLNKWLDIIYIASFAEIVESVLQWFQGTVVYRTFGTPPLSGYTEYSHHKGLDMNVFGIADNLVWSPILKSLNDNEDERLTRNTVYLPAFVSPERLPFRWAGRDSERRVTTLYSYLHSSNWTYENYEKFKSAFKSIDYTVLGRNDKRSPRCADPAIDGNVDFSTLMSRLTGSRLFCYGGVESPYHLHFTPMEAMTMDVPILFLEGCGLTREAREYGLAEEKLLALGMCASHEVMAEKAALLLDDFDALEVLRKAQKRVLLPVFGRDRALAIAASFVERETVKANDRRGDLYSSAAKPAPASQRVSAGRNITKVKSMPSAPGEYRMFSAPNIVGEVGALVIDDRHGYYVRRGDPAREHQGMLIREPVYKMFPGEYEFTLTLFVERVGDEPIGHFSAGVWDPVYRDMFLIPLLPQEAGIVSFRGIANIRDAIVSAKKEMRVVWFGQEKLDVLEIRVKKITDDLSLTSGDIIDFQWGSGFSIMEYSDERSWRWCASAGDLFIENRYSTSRSVIIKFSLETPFEEEANVTISGGLWNDRFKPHAGGLGIEKTLLIPPGKHKITFQCDGKRLEAPQDHRELVFQVINFHHSILE